MNKDFPCHFSKVMGEDAYKTMKEIITHFYRNNHENI